MKRNKEKKTNSGLLYCLNNENLDLTPIVEELCKLNNKLSHRNNNPCRQPLPSREVLVEIMEKLRSIFFPGYFGPSDLSEKSICYHIGATLDQVLKMLKDQVLRGLCFVCKDPKCMPDCRERAEKITQTFLKKLPEIKRKLELDVQAAFENDPAATSPDETIFCYPGVFAITNYRVAHELYKLEVPLIPRIITEHAHSVTGVDIHPGAEIGESFFIDHGTGVVIGETTIIGNRVKIYQGVTLGAKSFPLDEQGKPIKGIPRHPVVEDDVIIYGGATILGRIAIGRGSVIGGNVWLTHSVPPCSKVTQAQSRTDIFICGAGI